MMDTYKIASAVGRARMAEALEVGATAVSNAVVAGKFPASWFLVMQSLCDEKSIDCPPFLFGMKPTSGELLGNASSRVQGHGAGKSAQVSS